MRSHTIKAILLQPHWVVFSLVGVFFFFFALDRGGTNVFIWSSGVFLLIHTVNGSYRIGNIPLNLRVLSAVAAILVSALAGLAATLTAASVAVRMILILVFGSSIVFS